MQKTYKPDQVGCFKCQDIDRNSLPLLIGVFQDGLSADDSNGGRGMSNAY